MTVPYGIKLVAFDLDGTLVDDTIYVWKTLHEHFGSDPERRAKARSDYMAGRITYEQWFNIDLELLSQKGATKDSILSCFSGLRPAPGAMELLRELKKRGFILALISGSLDILLERFFPSGTFDHVMINHLEFDEEGFITGGQHTPFDLEGKALGLANLARKRGLTLSQCAFVGDNVNDVHVMKAAGFSVCVHPKHPDAKRAADMVLEGRELSPLLEIFGWPE